MTRTDPSPTRAASVRYTVVFSAAVTGVDATDFTLHVTGLNGAAVDQVSGTATTWTVTVVTGTGSGSLRLDLLDDNSILDGWGTPLGGTGVQNYSAGDVYSIDKTEPQVSSVVRLDGNPTAVASVRFTAIFSEGVTGVDATDFTLTMAGISGATVSSVSGSGTTWTVTVNTGTGNGTLRLDITDDNSILDGVGNPLGGAGLQHYTAGEVYTVDRIMPQVSSVVRADANPTAAPTVRYSVTFSQAVTGVGAADFSLNVVGPTGASVTEVIGSGTTYTVTVDTGSGSGTLRLDVLDDNTIVDGSGNPLGGAGVQDFASGEVYTVDKIVPQVASVVRLDASPTAAETVRFSVTFMEPVTGVDPGDFTIAAQGLAGTSVASVTGSGTTYTVIVNTGLGAGTLRLDVGDDNSIVDAAANPLGGLGVQPYTAGEVYAIDKMFPQVTEVSAVDGSPTAAASVRYTVLFSKSVTGVDAADFALDVVGLTGVGIANITGSGTTYTVTVNTGAGAGTLRLDATDNNSITDGVGNPLGGPGVQPDTTGQVYVIDKVAPVASSITRQDGNPTAAASVRFAVVFSEDVTGVDAADFLVVASGLTGANLGTVTGSGTTWTVTVNTGSGSGTLRLDITDDNSILDGVGNPLGGAGVQNFTSGESYTVDKTVPQVGSVVRLDANPTNAAGVRFLVTFSENVTGVDVSDFEATAPGLSGFGVSNVSGSGTTYTVAVDTGSGSGTLRLDVMDDNSIVSTGGNPLGGAGQQDYTAGEIYMVDKTAPNVVSILRADPSPTGWASVRYTVTFQESVTGVGTADFTLNAPGLSGTSVSNVSGFGSIYTVLVNTGSGDGSLRLDLRDDNSILDAAGNPLGGAGVQDYSSGEVYAIDHTAPLVSALVRADASPTGAGSVNYALTFSESVTGVDAVDFAVSATGVTGASVVNVVGSGTTYTVTVNTGSGSGTLRLDITDDNSIQDSAENPLGGAGVQNYTSGEVYTVDKIAPAVSSITRLDPSPTGAATVRYTVTFQESVTGVDTADFTINATGLSGTSVSGVTGSGSTYTVTVNTGSGSGTLRLDITDDNSILDGVGNPLGGAGVQN